MVRLVLALTLLWASVPAHATVAVRILLGVGDKPDTNWSGGVTARGARITAVEPWRFDATMRCSPAIVGRSARTSRAASAPLPRPGGANRLRQWRGGAARRRDGRHRARRGDAARRFHGSPERDSAGQGKAGLDGKASADRVPPYLAHHQQPRRAGLPRGRQRFRRQRSGWPIWSSSTIPITTICAIRPKNFDGMTAKPGGDQILLRKFSGGAWGEPIAITPAGGDLYRPAVAIDGKGRPWVFWSANEKGNFDVWARVVDGWQPGATVRLPRRPARISIRPRPPIPPARLGRLAGMAQWQGATFSPRRRTATDFPSRRRSPAPPETSGIRPSPPIPTVASAWLGIRIATATTMSSSAPRHAPAVGARKCPSRPRPITKRIRPSPTIPAGTLWVAYEEGAETMGQGFRRRRIHRRRALFRPRRPAARHDQGRQGRRDRAPIRAPCCPARRPPRTMRPAGRVNADEWTKPGSERVEESRRQPLHGQPGAYRRAPRNTLAAPEDRFLGPALAGLPHAAPVLLDRHRHRVDGVRRVVQRLGRGRPRCTCTTPTTCWTTGPRWSRRSRENFS